MLVESFWMVFGSDDAALRAAAEPHISLVLEFNFYRAMFDHWHIHCIAHDSNHLSEVYLPF